MTLPKLLNQKRDRSGRRKPNRNPGRLYGLFLVQSIELPITANI